MKTIKLLLVFVMFIMISQIGLSQIDKTYVVDSQGNATNKVVAKKTTEVCLHFKADVPELTDQQVSQLLKDRKIKFSQKKIKGHYEQFILFYVPRIEADSCFLSEAGVVSYQAFQAKDLPRMFTWWFVCALFGIFSMIIFHRIWKKLVFSALAAFLALLVFLALLAFITFVEVAGFIPLVVFAALFAFIVLDGLVAIDVVENNKKIAHIFIWLCSMCMFIIIMSLYFQW